MATAAKDLCDRYKKYVQDNPDTTGQVESLVKVLSYLLPAKFDNTGILSELLFSASQLLVLLNDAILRDSTTFKSFPISHPRLQGWLSVLDCVEVFLEVTTGKVWGVHAKWVVIVCVQVAKAAVRFLLLLKHKVGLQKSPPVPGVNRELVIRAKKTGNSIIQQSAVNSSDPWDPTSLGNNQAQTFTLGRSGRTVRSLSAAPPMIQRSWKLPAEPSSNKSMNNNVIFPPTTLNTTRTIAESLHISRPLIHLLSMYACGEASWKPWIVSCGVDLSSLCLMGDNRDFSPPERRELRRRTLMMLLYLLRSPFYDKLSRARILILLHVISNNIPIMNLISRPLQEYLPIWQKIYSYVWSV